MILAGSSGSKEPPPSYQDAVSTYKNSPIQPSDVLSGDDRQSLRPYAQYRGDEKSSTRNAASNEFRRRSEGGALGISAATAQNQMPVSTVDEDVTCRRKPQRSVTSTFPNSQASTTRPPATLTMQSNDEEVWKITPPIPASENAIATGSRRSGVAEDDKQADSEDLQCASRIDGSYEQPITPPSS